MFPLDLTLLWWYFNTESNYPPTIDFLPPPGSLLSLISHLPDYFDKHFWLYSEDYVLANELAHSCCHISLLIDNIQIDCRKIGSLQIACF